MGFNVGAIYVSAKDNATPGTVAEFIKHFWFKIGAKESAQDPKTFKPLGLAKTGCLGFAITPATKGADKMKWIGIYDSERYSADPALARALADHFKTDVWFYKITESVNQAFAKHYGKSEKTLTKFNDVVDLADGFPFSMLYYNKLNESLDKDLKGFVFLAFEAVPARLTAKYTGPDSARLGTNSQIELAKKAVATHDAATLIPLLKNKTVYFEEVKNAVEYADPSKPEVCDFLYALGPTLLAIDESSCSLMEAALRKNDEPLFEQAFSKMRPYSLFQLEKRALEILDKDPRIAFRLIEALTTTPRMELHTLNNAVCIQIRVVGKEGLPSNRIQALLEKAMAAAPSNPSIFHNVACVHVKRGEIDKALTCVDGAVKHGYDRLEEMKCDEDLVPLRSHPRFDQAFKSKNESFDWGPLSLLSPHRKPGQTLLVCITPTIGLHLYFKDQDARQGLADLLEKLMKEFPEMFSYFLPRDHVRLSPVKKGRLTRTINDFRKKEDPYSYKAYFNAVEGGGACDHRFMVELIKSERRKDLGGELNFHLPLSLAQDPEALVKKLIDYARPLPFLFGHAGYSLCGQYEGNGCSALQNIFQMLERHLGFTTSQIGLHCNPHIDRFMPNWLTFLNREKAERLSETLVFFKKKNRVHELDKGALVVQAAAKPIVGLVTNPTDVEDLPLLARAVKALWSVENGEGFWPLEFKRLEKLADLK